MCLCGFVHFSALRGSCTPAARVAPASTGCFQYHSSEGVCLPSLTMSRTPAHPLAAHPLEELSSAFACSLPVSSRAFLHTIALEASLRLCAPFVKGLVLDVGCGRRPYEKSFFSGASKYIGTDYLSDRSQPDVVS